MKSFKEYLLEAGQASGKLELVSTTVEKATKFAEESFSDNGMKLTTEIPNFNKNYQFAQETAGKGDTQRKDMPVIDATDIKAFQRRLEDGYIDHKVPYSKPENKSNPFPQGLSGKLAQKWLSGGLMISDGDIEDDRVNLSRSKVAVGKLLPIQKQIYADKSIASISDNGGAEKARKFLESDKTVFIVSKDNRIIDGHHRYLAGILIDPKMKVNVMKIDLPIDKLLPLTLAYSDAIDNKRNS